MSKGNYILLALVMLLLLFLGQQCWSRPSLEAGQRVRISSDLPGATLLIDGREQGSLPVTVYLQPGTYTFKIKPSAQWGRFVMAMEQLVTVQKNLDVQVIFLHQDRQLSLGPGSQVFWSQNHLWYARDEGLTQINTGTWTIQEHTLNFKILWLWARDTGAWLGSGEGWYYFEPGKGVTSLDYRALYAARTSRWPAAVDQAGNIRILSGQDGPTFPVQGQVLYVEVNSTGSHFLHLEDFAGTRRLVLTNIASQGQRILDRGDLSHPEFSPDGSFVSWLTGEERSFAPLTGSFAQWPGQRIAGTGPVLWLGVNPSDPGQSPWQGYAAVGHGEGVLAVFYGTVTRKTYDGPRPVEWQQVGNRVFALLDEGVGSLYWWADSITEDVTAGIRNRSVQSRARGVAPGKWAGSPCGKMLSYVFTGDGTPQVMLYILASE